MGPLLIRSWEKYPPRGGGSGGTVAPHWPEPVRPAGCSLHLSSWLLFLVDTRAQTSTGALDFYDISQNGSLVCVLVVFVKALKAKGSFFVGRLLCCSVDGEQTGRHGKGRY